MFNDLLIYKLTVLFSRTCNLNTIVAHTYMYAPLHYYLHTSLYTYVHKIVWKFYFTFAKSIQQLNYINTLDYMYIAGGHYIEQ